MQAQDRLSDISSDGIRIPAIFLGHGSPMVTIEFDDWNENLCNFVQNMPKPVTIVVLSGHWETDNEVRITSAMYPDQIYDFSKEEYPDTLFQLTYPCEGNPELASEIANMLNYNGITAVLDENRGLDHGAWVPLYIAYPDMEVPVLQISLPTNWTTQDFYKMGKVLASLRRRGVLFIGSGNLVNNKELADFSNKYAPPDQWALEFDGWFKEKLQDFDIQALLDFEKLAPHVDKAISGKSHIMPLFFILGTMFQEDHYVPLFEGFHYGNISMRSFALASNI